MEEGKKFIRLEAEEGLQYLREEEVVYLHFIERKRVLGYLGEKIR